MVLSGACDRLENKRMSFKVDTMTLVVILFGVGTAVTGTLQMFLA